MTANPSPALEWRTFIFTEMFKLLHHFETDNFDSARFIGLQPSIFFLPSHVAYLTYLVDNYEGLHLTRELLLDDESRHLFDRLILFRLLGHHHVRLPLSSPAGTAKAEVPENWLVAETTDGSEYGKLSIFAVPVADDVLWLKCWPGNISAHLVGQYYLERSGVSIRPETGDHVIDAGGCFGDTAAFFAQSVGANGHVYTFDPLSKHCQIINEVRQLNGILGERITLIAAGVSDVNEQGSVHGNVDIINPGARVGSGTGLPLRTIDGVVADGTIPRIDFIKMDIEGSELAALKGGEASIRAWRPNLAISLYHRLEDFCSIPQWINDLNLGYQLYLDHYSIHAEETVLYATAR